MCVCLFGLIALFLLVKFEMLCRLIAHGPTFRVEVYWTCAQPKCGVRCKETGKSMFCHSFPSFTILIHLCNELVT